MKRIGLIGIILLIVCGIGIVPVQAFDAISTAGFGWTWQGNHTAQPSFYVGFDAPVLTKSARGYTLTLETTYMYADYAEEIQAIRTFGINEKSLFRKTISMYVGLGGGWWIMTNTNGDDENLTAYLFQIKTTYKDFELKLTTDVVPYKHAPDIWFTSLGVTLGFF